LYEVPKELRFDKAEATFGIRQLDAAFADS
jgi:hypothetical protein